MPVSDVENAACTPTFFYENATDETVPLPRCLSCLAFHWYPMERCPHCLSERVEWTPVGVRGKVFSATTVRRAFTAATRGQTPYGIALVCLDDAPQVRIVCRVDISDGADPLAPGDAVTVRVEPDGAGAGIVRCAAAPPA